MQPNPEAFHLPAGGQQRVRLHVSLPANAEPGEHEVGVVFLVPAATSTDNLTVNRGVGTQLLVTAPGPVTHDIDLSGLNVPSFSPGGDIPVDLTVRNGGTVHEDFLAPDSRIIGDAEGQRLAFPNATVLGGVTRQLDTTWTDPPLFCHCQISVAIPDGNGDTATIQHDIWILPAYHLAGGFLLLIGATLIIRWRRTRHRTALADARQQGYETAALQQVT